MRQIIKGETTIILQVVLQYGGIGQPGKSKPKIYFAGPGAWSAEARTEITASHITWQNLGGGLYCVKIDDSTDSQGITANTGPVAFIIDDAETSYDLWYEIVDIIENPRRYMDGYTDMVTSNLQYDSNGHPTSYKVKKYSNATDARTDNEENAIAIFQVSQSFDSSGRLYKRTCYDITE